jgi:cysteine-rich repeat protein
MRALVSIFIVTFIWSCSEPQCGPREVKVGTSCRKLVLDGGLPDGVEMGEMRSDAAAASGSTSPDDADAAVTNETKPFCGDGILNGTELCDPKIAAGQPGACLTAPDCENNKCTLARLTGSPDACNVRCERSKQDRCADGDECCPAGCNYQNDDACSATCGDGVIDDNETCEPDIGAGCAVSCTASSSCEIATLVGDIDNCNVECMRTKIVAPSSEGPGDGCCPDGANALTDKDCLPTCMNGIKEAAETCDGADCPTICNDSDPCTGPLPPNGSTASCNVTCPTRGYPTIAPADNDELCCPGAGPLTDSDCTGCGNGKVEGSEQCDDANATSGDLCDQNCRREDNPNTPGDDRVGYVTCGNSSCLASTGCSAKYTLDPVTKAVSWTYRCGLEADATVSWTCDGPEECPAGQVCALPDTKSIVMKCVPPSNLGFACHVPADCGTRGPCGGGTGGQPGVCPAMTATP